MIHRILSITPTAWEPEIITVCGTTDNPADAEGAPCPECRPDEHAAYMKRMNRLASEGGAARAQQNRERRARQRACYWCSRGDVACPIHSKASYR